MFLMSEGMADTTLKKYKELLELREEVCRMSIIQFYELITNTYF